MNATRFFSSCLLSAMIVTSASLPAYAQVKRTGDSYLLRMKFKVGDTAKYQMTMSGDMMPAGINVSMTSVVKKVAGDTADVEYTTTPPAGAPGGGKPTKTTFKIDNRGKVIGGNAQAAQQFNNVQLPEKAVKIGQTWAGNASGGMGMNLKTTYKLVGTKLVGGQDCAQIGVTLASTSGQMKISGTGTMFLRMGDCSLQNATVNVVVNGTMPGQNGGAGRPMNIKQKVAIIRK